MPIKPTYEELERRVLELEGREHCRNKSEIVAFPQFEKHGAIILVIDPDSGIIITANIAAQNYYGYSIKTLKQMKIQDINILPPDKLIAELEKTLSQVQTLSGLLPICSYCKKIRDDKGYWEQIDTYIGDHSDVDFSHSICPECVKKYYPDIDLYDDNETQQ